MRDRARRSAELENQEMVGDDGLEPPTSCV